MFGREFVVNFRKKQNDSAEQEIQKEAVDIVAIVDEIGDHLLRGFLIAAAVVAGLVTASCVIVNQMNPANHD